ncbi:CsbA family protein [Bacillus carboniphilus]|uniref:CsbA family protein n=1 Tax=Bacillus carboniphilus TaxID=86663 RepID=A0ABN0VVE7_9BACI
MIDKVIAAIFLPALLVILFARVTYSSVVALIITVALITASAYKGFTHTWYVNIIDAMSLTFGFWYSRRMLRNLKTKSKEESG